MTAPQLSILVPTTARRKAFWPWLSWNIAKQTGLPWQAIEVVTASPDGERVELDVSCAIRRTYYRGRLPLGLIRNGLVMRARGQYLAWFDDDDWHAPDRLERMLSPAPRNWIGATGLRYLDIATGGVAEVYSYRARVVPTTVVGRRDLLSAVAFREDIKHGSDTHWLQALQAHAPGESIERGPLPYFFALRHAENMSPQLAGFRSDDGRELRRMQACAGWDETDAQIKALLARILS